MLYLNPVRFVDKARTVQEWVSISYKTRMQVAPSTQSFSHALEQLLQEAGIGSLASSSHPYLFYDNFDHVKVLAKRSSLSLKYQLKIFFQECTPCLRKGFLTDQVLS